MHIYFILFVTASLDIYWEGFYRSQHFVLALPTSVIRSQEAWHNSLAVTISRLNRLQIILVHRAWDNAAEKYSKWFLNIFVLLWDLNQTPSASRAITLPTRPHHPKFWIQLRRITNPLSGYEFNSLMTDHNRRRQFTLMLKAVVVAILLVRVEKWNIFGIILSLFMMLIFKLN